VGRSIDKALAISWEGVIGMSSSSRHYK